MSDVITLSAESIDAIARRVVELQRVTVADADPRFTREQAAQYLNLPLRSFDRKRKACGASLAPVDLHPMRWSKNALDVFKMGGAGLMPARRGRKRQEQAA